MKTLKEQTDAKIAAGRKKNPEFMKGVDDIIVKAKAFQQGGKAIKIGEKSRILNYLMLLETQYHCLIY